MLNLYLLEINQLKTCYSEILELITYQRRLKLQKFSKEADQLRSLAAGFLMFQVLGITKDEQLVYNQYGKPALKQGPEFNLSHSGNWVALATGIKPLGVDIEPIRETRWQAARRALQEQEIEWLKKSCSPERDFYWLWTRKESLLKASGQGLCCNPHSFSVLPPEQEFFVLNQQVYGLSSFAYAEQMISLAVLEQKPTVKRIFIWQRDGWIIEPF